MSDTLYPNWLFHMVLTLRHIIPGILYVKTFVGIYDRVYFRIFKISRNNIVRNFILFPLRIKQFLEFGLDCGPYGSYSHNSLHVTYLHNVNLQNVWIRVKEHVPYLF